MSKQEALYETNQDFKYKGKKIKLRFSEEYFDIVPRATPEERQQLKEDIKINGLFERVSINNQGIILDGHTRIEICEELGWKTVKDEPIELQFSVRNFNTLDEEREYVLKTNLIRRQLNSFQKVRLVFKLYQNNRLHPNNQRLQNLYDVLTELKKHKKPVKSKVLGDVFGWDRATMNRLLRQLKEEFCVGNKSEKIKFDTVRGKRGSAYYVWYILPKGEEILYKGRPKNYSLKTLARSIGLERNLVAKAIWLMEHANSYTLNSLEQGRTSIMNAYVEMTKQERLKKVSSYQYLKGSTEVICPHCEHVSLKKDWKIAK